ncbi:hypothetical protein M0R72_09955 [Candidatus Pacearchaeota archaeon]|nr:hypothetical protein [Candidatus Pacearchaeota archaeon]
MEIEKFYVKLRNKLILFFRKFFRDIRIDKKKKRLVLNEKYEKAVKYTLRISTFLGIISSVLTLPIEFSLIISILLVLIEQILEKTIFMFNTLFVQPIPAPEDLKKAEWYANRFGFIQGNVADKKFLVGLVFKDKEAGKKIFECISAWNNLETWDMEDNIKLSFIIEDDQNYSTYLYPSENRKIMKKFWSKIRKNGKQHNKLIYMLIMCKVFPYGKDSSFYKFKKEYEDFYLFTINGKPQEYKQFTLEGFYIENGKMIPLDNPPIQKFHLKIKNRKDLTKEDVEYEHGKFIMEKL